MAQSLYELGSWEERERDEQRRDEQYSREINEIINTMTVSQIDDEISVSSEFIGPSDDRRFLLISAREQLEPSSISTRTIADFLRIFNPKNDE